MSNRAIIYCVMILSLNLSLSLLEGIDGVNIHYSNRSLFGQVIAPYQDYGSVDYGGSERYNLSNKNDLENMTQKEMSFSPPSGTDSNSDWWSIIKGSISTILNVFKKGLFGLPVFLSDRWNLSPIFSYPLYTIIGIVWLMGLLQLKGGVSNALP